MNLCSVLMGGFPEMKTFGYRCKRLSNSKYSKYDVVIDNQSIKLWNA